MKTLYIDMDNVLADFPSGMAACDPALLEWIRFGHEPFRSWAEVVAYLKDHAAQANQEHEVTR